MIVIMSDELINQLLAMAERTRVLEHRAYLFHRDDSVELLYIVEKGRLELIRPQEDGSSIVLQRADAHTVLAEASLYSDTYHCDAIAVSPSVVATISKPIFLSRLHADTDFALLWSSHLATEMQKSRFRSEILSKRTVAERLDGWLSFHDNTLPPKGEWKSVAIQIGVSPEALYRELSRRR